MRIKMQAANPDVESVSVKGRTQMPVKNGIVEVDEADAAELEGMGFRRVTSEDDIVLTEEAWLAKNGHDAYMRYLGVMRARLGNAFVDPNVVTPPPEAFVTGKGGKGQPAPARA